VLCARGSAQRARQRAARAAARARHFGIIFARRAALRSASFPPALSDTHTHTHNATQERRARAVAAFHHFDADASGSIDRHEFRAALCALGVVRALSADASAAKIDAEFARIDTDRSGSLCVDEFVRFYLEAEEKAAADAARDGAALAKFAELAQGAAFIEKDKFWHALLGLGLFHGLTVEQAVDKARGRDVAGRGRVVCAGLRVCCGLGVCALTRARVCVCVCAVLCGGCAGE
jgi:regulator of protease activity HflC (stomatin/prohibitin superfamily)